MISMSLANHMSVIITSMWSLSPLLGVNIIHLVERTDLLNISNLVYGGRESVTSLYSSLEGQRQTVNGGYSELAGSPFVSVKTDGLGNFLEKLMYCKLGQLLDILNRARKVPY
jgi:hypothetical protein